MKRFSSELGIVIHFLSDYFCLAHNSKQLDPFIPHLIYEIKLGQEFLKTDLDDIIRLTICDREDYQSQIPLIDIIQEKHYSYLMLPDSTTKDILYSINVCSVAAYSIIGGSISNISSKAA